jgi:predicted RNA-binding protein with PUA-like domain
MMKYWILKSDPEEFGWNHLKALSSKETTWDGVRNYQARNFLKEMKTGDKALFYHSNTQPQSIVGITTIIREAYPDFTQFDKDHAQYDSKSSKENPTWVMVDIRYEEDIDPPITREEMKNTGNLQEMLLFRNSRLSVLPVTQDQWQTILNLRKKQ